MEYRPLTEAKWKRAQELFLELASHRPEEREALLAEACGDDAELLAEVRSLLAHDELADDAFLRPPEVPPGIRRPDFSADGPDPLVGRTIGDCEITGVVGAGGMGTVYEAIQRQPHRVVAVKVMRRRAASRSTIRRFQFESEALARLRHPNILQVFQAGMYVDREGLLGPRNEPTPYFVMEYVPDPKTITRYSEENDLDLRARLELFAKVCDAVHHGHQKGIIHRDLKPANILVDTAGEPKVIDFGVARATDADVALTTMQTDPGQLVGTLQYMSPEQCDADPREIDTRSDVYSLGAMLFELLTGALPYDAAESTIYKATRAIKEHLPPRPSSINPKLRGDVETIVLKSLEKDREGRYQSAAELASDIRRFLNHEPIAARRPTAWTRSVRWIIRHPIATTAVACLTVAAVILGAVSVTFWHVSTRPYEIRLLKDPGREILPQGYQANLMAPIGSLKSWSADGPLGIAIASLVERPAESGGGLVAVVGTPETDIPSLPRGLCAFDADGDLERPLWTRAVGADDPLPEYCIKRGFSESEFALRFGSIANVFPSLPGDEIVAVFNHESYSPHVIQIYNLAGDLLYRVWYDGVINTCHWMKDAGLLAFGGDYHGGLYGDNGQPNGEQLREYVVFALRPEPGLICDDWLKPTARPEGGDAPVPAWFLRVRPLEVVDAVSYLWIMPPPRNSHDAARSVHCAIGFASDGATDIALTLDEHGKEIPETRIAGDGYMRDARGPRKDSASQRLPDPDQIELVPFD